MRLKMLIGMSGPGFTVDPGDVTEHFSKKEAARLIRAGYAEEAPPVERKKPETKREWDEERATLLAENEQLKADARAFSEREAALLSQVKTLTSFKDSVTAAVHVIYPPVETTVTEDNRETRG